MSRFDPYPATRAALQDAQFRFLAASACKCGVAIEWWVTPTGKKIPMLPMPALTSEALMHWDNCPLRGGNLVEKHSQRCAAVACTQQVPYGHIFCLAHWEKLPAHMHNALREAYRSFCSEPARFWHYAVQREECIIHIARAEDTRDEKTCYQRLENLRRRIEPEGGLFA